MVMPLDLEIPGEIPSVHDLLNLSLLPPEELRLPDLSNRFPGSSAAATVVAGTIVVSFLARVMFLKSQRRPLMDQWSFVCGITMSVISIVAFLLTVSINATNTHDPNTLPPLLRFVGYPSLSTCTVGDTAQVFGLLRADGVCRRVGWDAEASVFPRRDPLAPGELWASARCSYLPSAVRPLAVADFVLGSSLAACSSSPSASPLLALPANGTCISVTDAATTTLTNATGSDPILAFSLSCDAGQSFVSSSDAVAYFRSSVANAARGTFVTNYTSPDFPSAIDAAVDRIIGELQADAPSMPPQPNGNFSVRSFDRISREIFSLQEGSSSANNSFVASSSAFVQSALDIGAYTTISIITWFQCVMLPCRGVLFATLDDVRAFRANLTDSTVIPVENDVHVGRMFQFPLLNQVLDASESSIFLRRKNIQGSTSGWSKIPPRVSAAPINGSVFFSLSIDSATETLIAGFQGNRDEKAAPESPFHDVSAMRWNLRGLELLTSTKWKKNRQQRLSASSLLFDGQWHRIVVRNAANAAHRYDLTIDDAAPVAFSTGSVQCTPRNAKPAGMSTSPARTAANPAVFHALPFGSPATAFVRARISKNPILVAPLSLTGGRLGKLMIVSHRLDTYDIAHLSPVREDEGRDEFSSLLAIGCVMIFISFCLMLLKLRALSARGAGTAEASGMHLSWDRSQVAKSLTSTAEAAKSVLSCKTLISQQGSQSIQAGGKAAITVLEVVTRLQIVGSFVTSWSWPSLYFYTISFAVYVPSLNFAITWWFEASAVALPLVIACFAVVVVVLCVWLFSRDQQQFVEAVPALAQEMNRFSRSRRARAAAEGSPNAASENIADVDDDLAEFKARGHTSSNAVQFKNLYRILLDGVPFSTRSAEARDKEERAVRSEEDQAQRRKELNLLEDLLVAYPILASTDLELQSSLAGRLPQDFSFVHVGAAGGEKLLSWKLMHARDDFPQGSHLYMSSGRDNSESSTVSPLVLSSLEPEIVPVVSSMTNGTTRTRCLYRVGVEYLPVTHCPRHPNQRLVERIPREHLAHEEACIKRGLPSPYACVHTLAHLNPIRCDPTGKLVHKPCDMSAGFAVCPTCTYAVCSVCQNLGLVDKVKQAIVTKLYDWGNITYIIGLIAVVGIEAIVTPLVKNILMLLICHEEYVCVLQSSTDSSKACFSATEDHPEYVPAVVIGLVALVAIIVFLLYVAYLLYVRKQIIAKNIFSVIEMAPTEANSTANKTEATHGVGSGVTADPAELLAVVTSGIDDISWRHFVTVDRSLMKTLYSTFEFRYMLLWPGLILLKILSVACMVLLQADSIPQLALTCVWETLGAFLIVALEPFDDNWSDDVSSAGSLHQVLLLSLTAFFRFSKSFLTASAMLAVSGVYAVFIVATFIVLYRRVKMCALWDRARMGAHFALRQHDMEVLELMKKEAPAALLEVMSSSGDGLLHSLARLAPRASATDKESEKNLVVDVVALFEASPEQLEHLSEMQNKNGFRPVHVALALGNDRFVSWYLTNLQKRFNITSSAWNGEFTGEESIPAYRQSNEREQKAINDAGTALTAGGFYHSSMDRIEAVSQLVPPALQLHALRANNSSGLNVIGQCLADLHPARLNVCLRLLGDCVEAKRLHTSKKFSSKDAEYTVGTGSEGLPPLVMIMKAFMARETQVRSLIDAAQTAHELVTAYSRLDELHSAAAACIDTLANNIAVCIAGFGGPTEIGVRHEDTTANVCNFRFDIFRAYCRLVACLHQGKNVDYDPSIVKACGISPHRILAAAGDVETALVAVKNMNYAPRYYKFAPDVTFSRIEVSFDSFESYTSDETLHPFVILELSEWQLNHLVGIDGDIEWNDQCHGNQKGALFPMPLARTKSLFPAPRKREKVHASVEFRPPVPVPQSPQSVLEAVSPQASMLGTLTIAEMRRVAKQRSTYVKSQQHLFSSADGLESFIAPFYVNHRLRGHSRLTQLTFSLAARVGGGGGHTLTVKNFRAVLHFSFPRCTHDEPRVPPCEENATSIAEGISVFDLSTDSRVSMQAILEEITLRERAGSSNNISVNPHQSTRSPKILGQPEPERNSKLSNFLLDLHDGFFLNHSDDASIPGLQEPLAPHAQLKIDDKEASDIIQCSVDTLRRHYPHSVKDADPAPHSLEQKLIESGSSGGEGLISLRKAGGTASCLRQRSIREKIKSATFGCMTSYRRTDVTERVRRNAELNRGFIQSGRELFGDNAPGEHKELLVEIESDDDGGNAEGPVRGIRTRRIYLNEGAACHVRIRAAADNHRKTPTVDDWSAADLPKILKERWGVEILWAKSGKLQEPFNTILSRTTPSTNDNEVDGFPLHFHSFPIFEEGTEKDWTEPCRAYAAYFGVIWTDRWVFHHFFADPVAPLVIILKKAGSVYHECLGIPSGQIYFITSLPATVVIVLPGDPPLVPEASLSRTVNIDGLISSRSGREVTLVGMTSTKNADISLVRRAVQVRSVPVLCSVVLRYWREWHPDVRLAALAAAVEDGWLVGLQILVSAESYSLFDQRDTTVSRHQHRKRLRDLLNRLWVVIESSIQACIVGPLALNAPFIDMNVTAPSLEANGAALPVCAAHGQQQVSRALGEMMIHWTSLVLLSHFCATIPPPLRPKSIELITNTFLKGFVALSWQPQSAASLSRGHMITVENMARSGNVVLPRHELSPLILSDSLQMLAEMDAELMISGTGSEDDHNSDFRGGGNLPAAKHLLPNSSSQRNSKLRIFREAVMIEAIQLRRWKILSYFLALSGTSIHASPVLLLPRGMTLLDMACVCGLYEALPVLGGMACSTASRTSNDEEAERDLVIGLIKRVWFTMVPPADRVQMQAWAQATQQTGDANPAEEDGVVNNVSRDIDHASIDHDAGEASLPLIQMVIESCNYTAAKILLNDMPKEMAKDSRFAALSSDSAAEVVSEMVSKPLPSWVRTAHWCRPQWSPLAFAASLRASANGSRQQGGDPLLMCQLLLMSAGGDPVARNAALWGVTSDLPYRSDCGSPMGLLLAATHPSRLRSKLSAEFYPSPEFLTEESEKVQNSSLLGALELLVHQKPSEINFFIPACTISEEIFCTAGAALNATQEEDGRRSGCPSVLEPLLKSFQWNLLAKLAKLVGACKRLRHDNNSNGNELNELASAPSLDMDLGALLAAHIFFHVLGPEMDIVARRQLMMPWADSYRESMPGLGCALDSVAAAPTPHRSNSLESAETCPVWLVHACLDYSLSTSGANSKLLLDGAACALKALDDVALNAKHQRYHVSTRDLLLGNPSLATNVHSSLAYRMKIIKSTDLAAVESSDSKVRWAPPREIMQVVRALTAVAVATRAESEQLLETAFCTKEVWGKKTC